LSSNVSDVFPKVLKVSSEVSECEPLPPGAAGTARRAATLQRRKLNLKAEFERSMSTP